MTIFDRIKEVAKQQKKSLTSISIEAGLGEKSLYKWKDNMPTADRVKAVADVLGVSTDYLLGNSDNMYASKNDASTDELIAAHWGIDLSELSPEKKAIVMSHAIDYIKGLVDALESESQKGN